MELVTFKTRYEGATPTLVHAGTSTRVNSYVPASYFFFLLAEVKPSFYINHQKRYYKKYHFYTETLTFWKESSSVMS